MVKLDILSDPVCPWCLIGKAELDRAAADDKTAQAKGKARAGKPGVFLGCEPRAQNLAEGSTRSDGHG